MYYNPHATSGLSLLVAAALKIDEKDRLKDSSSENSEYTNKYYEGIKSENNEQANIEYADNVSIDEDNDTDNEETQYHQQQLQQPKLNQNSYYYQPPSQYPVYNQQTTYPYTDSYGPRRNSWEYGMYVQRQPSVPYQHQQQTTQQPYYCETPGCNCADSRYPQQTYSDPYQHESQTEQSVTSPQPHHTQSIQPSLVKSEQSNVNSDSHLISTTHRKLDKSISLPSNISSKDTKSNITKIKKKRVSKKKISKTSSTEVVREIDSNDSSNDDDSDGIEDGQLMVKRKQTGPSKGSLKKRLPRTILSTDQIRELEVYFEEDYLPSASKMNTIALRLGLERRVVRVWFQNRRARQKRSKSSNKPVTEVEPSAFTKSDNFLNFSSPAVAN